MEIPAWLFFSFWALISITFLHLAFFTLDKTELSNSVSPVIMSLFKHSLAISCCCSSSQALVFGPQALDRILNLYWWVSSLIYLELNYRSSVLGFLWCLFLSSLTYEILINYLALLLHHFPKLKFFVNMYSVTTVFWVGLLFILIRVSLLLPTALIPFFTPVLTFLNFLFLAVDNGLARQVKARIAIHMAVETSLCYVGGGNTDFFPILVLFVSFSISAIRAALSGFSPLTGVYGYPTSGVGFFNELLSAPVFSALTEKRTGQMIGFAVGMVGTILFQYFFRLTTFDHVVAFLYLAVMWAANLAMVGVSSDFGVFNFLLGNVVVGCTVSQFGLQKTTWFAYGVCLVLYCLRLKLESLTLLYGRDDYIHVSLWFESSLLPI